MTFNGERKRHCNKTHRQKEKTSVKEEKILNKYKQLVFADAILFLMLKITSSNTIYKFFKKKILERHF